MFHCNVNFEQLSNSSNVNTSINSSSLESISNTTSLCSNSTISVSGNSSVNSIISNSSSMDTCPLSSNINDIIATMPSLGSISNRNSNSSSSVHSSVNSSINSMFSDMSTISDNYLLSDSFRQQSDESKNTANVHHLWQSGMWTSAKQYPSYCDDNKNSVFKPRLSVIEPNTLDNINILSYISNGDSDSSSKNVKFEENNRQKKIGSFKNYVFFSKRATYSFQSKLGSHGKNIDFQSLYQFEARYFQYSILRGNIRFVKDFSNNNTEYLIFKFGRSAQVSNSHNRRSKCQYVPLYGICEINDRAFEQQPWCCQHILTLEEMIKFFNLTNEKQSTQDEFLSFMEIESESIKKEFNTKYDYNPNINKITRMLKHGFYDYHRGMAKRRFGNDNGMSDDVHTKINSKYSNYNSKNSKHNGNKRDGKGLKIKNEDKFYYLSEVCGNLRTDWKGFLEILGDAIEDAFKFAVEHPESVLTQSYIDEDHGTISFELVILAEIFDAYTNQVYKFAIPIVECQNKDTKQYYYLAKNILTPKMAIDNIRLNSKHGVLDSATWVREMPNNSYSFYKQIDAAWHSNNVDCDNDNLDASSNCKFNMEEEDDMKAELYITPNGDEDNFAVQKQRQHRVEAVEYSQCGYNQDSSMFLNDYFSQWQTSHINNRYYDNYNNQYNQYYGGRQSYYSY